MNRTRTRWTVIPFAAVLALSACGSDAPSDPTAVNDCPEGLAACTEFGEPVLRYCPSDEGACDGHSIRPDEVGGHLFAGVTVTGSGKVDR